MNNNLSHTFAICAYKESPYLEECICSLMEQTVKSKIILATSTPCEYIENLCQRYDIPMYINEGESGITQDWNYAISCCDSDIVTVAHQDDIYYPDYTSRLLEFASQARNPVIFFSEYNELRNGEHVHNNTNLRIKRAMLFPLRGRVFRNNRWVRRRILSLGDPICCPAVSFFRANTPEVIFKNHFRTNEDWEAWELLSKRKGEFLYCKEYLMAHRIHEDSETTAMIQESGRGAEDYEMYLKFWPAWIARILCKLYKKSEDQNAL